MTASRLATTSARARARLSTSQEQAWSAQQMRSHLPTTRTRRPPQLTLCTTSQMMMLPPRCRHGSFGRPCVRHYHPSWKRHCATASATRSSEMAHAQFTTCVTTASLTTIPRKPTRDRKNGITSKMKIIRIYTTIGIGPGASRTLRQTGTSTRACHSSSAHNNRVAAARPRPPPPPPPLPVSARVQQPPPLPPLPPPRRELEPGEW